jgi:quercetin dioxygenase-like cupin family protein
MTPAGEMLAIAFRRRIMFKKIEMFQKGGFSETGIGKLLVHDSPYMKAINFNFKAGQELPIHSHDIEGQLLIVVLEGTGEFLGKNGLRLPAEAGDVLVSDISEPHGVKALTDLKVLVVIAPPI